MTMNKPELEALLERVRAATGPDREIDEAIDASLYHNGLRHYGDHEVLPRFTASIDASVALIGRVLPGWMHASGNCGEESMPWACLTEPEEPCRDFAADAPTEPLALIEAAIKALISTSEAEE